jgi:hypothetical protein
MKADRPNSETVELSVENCIINNFISNQGDRDGCRMWRIWGKGEIHIRFRWGNLREDFEVVLEWNGVEWVHLAPDRD